MTLANQLAAAPSISLQAHDPPKGIARSYCVHRTADLFGHHIVDWSWGRIGSAGQRRRVSFAREQDACRFVRRLLQRRDTAERRIGVAYRQVAAPAASAPAASAPATVLPTPAAAAPAAQPLPSLPPAGGLTRPSWLLELRYRLVRYGIGIAGSSARSAQLFAYANCAERVLQLLAEVAELSGPLPNRIPVAAEAALRLADRLEGEGEVHRWAAQQR